MNAFKVSALGAIDAHSPVQIHLKLAGCGALRQFDDFFVPASRATRSARTKKDSTKHWQSPVTRHGPTTTPVPDDEFANDL